MAFSYDERNLYVVTHVDKKVNTLQSSAHQFRVSSHASVLAKLSPPVGHRLFQEHDHGQTNVCRRIPARIEIFYINCGT